jgi:hypothetical protein
VKITKRGTRTYYAPDNTPGNAFDRIGDEPYTSTSMVESRDPVRGLRVEFDDRTDDLGSAIVQVGSVTVHLTSADTAERLAVAAAGAAGALRAYAGRLAPAASADAPPAESQDGDTE